MNSTIYQYFKSTTILFDKYICIFCELMVYEYLYKNYVIMQLKYVII